MKCLRSEKKLIILSLILSLVLITGCSSNESSKNKESSLFMHVTAPNDSQVSAVEVSFPEHDIPSQSKSINLIGARVAFKVDELEEGTNYDLQLRAKNSAGEVVATEEGVVDPASAATMNLNFAYPQQDLEPNKEFNQLRIYEVMVEAYQDGDSGADYGVGYGTSHHRGDIKGITAAMPYIASLNVNAIWLTPVFHSQGNTKLDATGYYADNYFEIDPNFGTEEEFRELVETAHEHGLYVIMDGVFGHYGAANKELQSPQGYSTTAGEEIRGVSGLIGYEAQYPESLNYFKEVATYWIEEYNIDGWRLDQAYQLKQGGHNYLQDIRLAVEEVAQTRRENGKEWGTLGYIVGELWKGKEEISELGYEDNALRSAFDFPVRYSLLQVLASQEDTSVGWANDQPAEKLAGESGIQSHRDYPNYAQPNLMLTNHDLVRFGDLIQRAEHLGYGKENPDYWKRHKAAFSFMAAYTGSITLYYGDEIGAEVAGYVNNEDSVSGEKIYDDHASRDSGRISGFNSQEQELKNYVADLMELRKKHPALWNGDYQFLTTDDDIYSVLKTDSATGERILYILNADTKQRTLNISGIGGSALQDLMTGERISGAGDYSISIPGLKGRFLLVN
ncbi:MAG: alpha-amylase family glycosyl hydrolase [Halanaerobacter sp.]